MCGLESGAPGKCASLYLTSWYSYVSAFHWLCPAPAQSYVPSYVWPKGFVSNKLCELHAGGARLAPPYASENKKRNTVNVGEEKRPLAVDVAELRHGCDLVREAYVGSTGTAADRRDPLYNAALAT